MILYVYYIELVTRIPKYIHFPFYDFCTIYYKFPNIQPITEINKTLKKEKGSLGPKRPSLAWSSGQGSPSGAGCAHGHERLKRGNGSGGPSAQATAQQAGSGEPTRMSPGAVANLHEGP